MDILTPLLVMAACIIIPFVFAFVKKHFIPALWAAVINELFFIGTIFFSFELFFRVLGFFLMGVTALIAIIKTIKESNPPPQRSAHTASTPKLSDGEQVILARVCPHIVPWALIIQGVLAFIIGLGFTLDKDEDVAVPLIFIGLAAMGIGYILMDLLAINLTITNKRVIVNSAFNFRKSLPINRISAVSTLLFHTLYVGSSAGRIILPFVPEFVEVYDTINALQNQTE